MQILTVVDRALLISADNISSPHILVNIDIQLMEAVKPKNILDLS